MRMCQNNLTPIGFGSAAAPECRGERKFRRANRARPHIESRAIRDPLHEGRKPPIRQKNLGNHLSHRLERLGEKTRLWTALIV